jgi:ferrous iron transport protein A
MKLSELNINTKGIIKNVMDGPVTAKLFEFGVLPGAKFTVIARAAFKGPIYLRVGTNLIALRRKEAEFIIVE